MKKEVYYVKSFEEDFVTKSLNGTEKITYQTVFDIVKTKTIKPNTKSFGRELRLSCTILNKNYTKTYRPHGIIFQTSQKPDYMFPFDLVLLSATNNIIVHYYRIKNKLHVYYNHTLIPGFEKFIFKDFNKMGKEIPNPEIAWKKVNDFRTAHGYKTLPKQKYRLVEYNEVVFHKPVKITPVALYGYTKQTRTIAKKLGLPYFVSAKKFYNKIDKKRKANYFGALKGTGSYTKEDRMKDRKGQLD